MNKVFYAKPEILSRPEIKEGHIVIEASAGTGKTFTIEHLIVDLILTGQAKVEEILVVTFTDAATRELRERVRSLLQKLMEDVEGRDLENPEELYWCIDDLARGRLREALFRFDGASIFTIHGFCQRVLSEQAFLGKHLFELKHVEGSKIFGEVFREEVRVVLAGQEAASIVLQRMLRKKGNLSQLEILMHRCYGEGFPDRCQVTPVYDPDRFFAALQRLPRKELLMEAGENIFSNARTLRAFNDHLEELYLLAASDNNDTKLYLDRAAEYAQWAEKTRTLSGTKFKQGSIIPEMCKRGEKSRVFSEFAVVLDELNCSACDEESAAVHLLLPRIRLRLETRKKSLGLIDYNDMLTGVQTVLAGDEGGSLLAVLRNRWKYGLVDEFQDTDPVQWDIFKRIFVDGADRQRLFIIGDPKQAIYGFRGADVHTYKKATDYLLSSKKAHFFELDKNYRSGPGLIDGLNHIFKMTVDSDGGFFSGINRYEHPVKSGLEKLGSCINGKPLKPLKLIHLHDDKDKLTSFSIKKGLATFIAEEIKHILSPSHLMMVPGKEGELKPLRHSDIYILTRTTEEGKNIGKVLALNGIPHAYYKQDGLFQSEEAIYVYRLLYGLNNPDDPGARMSAWLTPFFSIPLSDMPSWKDVSNNHRVVKLLYQWKHLADNLDWPDFFDKIINDSGLIRRLVFENNERSITNYLHLFEILLAETYARPVTLRRLTEELKMAIDNNFQTDSKDENIQRLETDREAVQILTMHKAKGLEAEVVFLAGGFSGKSRNNNEGRVYHRNYERHRHLGRARGELNAVIEREEQEENERLLYVAMTRAKSRLYLPYFGPLVKADNNRGSSGYPYMGKFYNTLHKRLEKLFDKDKLLATDIFTVAKASCEIEWSEALPENNEEEINNLEERLLEIPPSAYREARELISRHCGVLLTSFTRMKHGSGHYPSFTGSDLLENLRNEEITDESTFQQIDRDHDLPGGKEIGIFLHELLESISFELIKGLNFEQWLTMSEKHSNISIMASRYNLGKEHCMVAKQLVFNTLKTAVNIKDKDSGLVLNIPGGISTVEKPITEMSFVYPIPEKFHLLFDRSKILSVRSGKLPFEAVRGFIRGIIDLVFEYDGKIYLLDWKSDRLQRFDQQYLASYVENNYRLQAIIYTLAVLRLLSIQDEKDYTNRFGGILYAFVRGIRQGDLDQEGIWYTKPAWKTVVGWEYDLMERKEWGGSTIDYCGNDDG